MEDEINNAFTVMPMNQKIPLTPGETYEGSISVVNPSYATEEFHYKAEVTPYGVNGEKYVADLMHETARTSIAKWIEILEPTGTIQPNESKKIKFKITVPKDAPGGGQYATIAISSNQEAGKSDGVTVQNIFEIASIIYGEVDGEIIHEGEILENNIPAFVLAKPVKLSAILTNSGNVHESATFTVKVSDLFTGNVILPTDENDGRYSEVIMPDTTRLSEREVSELPDLGVVKVTQTIDYNGQTSTNEQTMIICPIWLIVLVIVTVLSIIAAIVFLVKKHRRKV